MVVLAVLATACNNAPGATGASNRDSSSIAWKPCGPGLACGSVLVPLDYADPAAATIAIAVIRKRATSPARRIGSLLLNPGGPGVSGVDFVRQSASYFAALNDRFDLVGFDPRGVGESSPVHCESRRELDNIMSTVPHPERDQRDELIRADKALALACERNSGKAFGLVDTISAAKDMDRLRVAVGDDKLTYLGFSYGTFLGETYAHIFPTHIRALALDAVVDPAVGPLAQLLEQAAGFEAGLQGFFAYCRAHASCVYGQGDPATKLDALLKRLERDPLHVGERTLTRSQAITAVMAGLYSPDYWEPLAAALHAAEVDNGETLLLIADAYQGRRPDGSYTNEWDANLAINCLDRPVPSDMATYDQLGLELAKASPLFGPQFQFGYLVCAYWPVKPTGIIGPVSADGAAPILLVGATHDPATPYSEAQAVNRELAGSVLVTRDGYGHGSYALSDCARMMEDAYLLDLTVPAKGTVCESNYP
jgi:pimeloyl-ACP methyl ester carboxylesterase